MKFKLAAKSPHPGPTEHEPLAGQGAVRFKGQQMAGIWGVQAVFVLEPTLEGGQT
jgi:hypothetical protein